MKEIRFLNISLTPCVKNRVCIHNFVHDVINVNVVSFVILDVLNAGFIKSFKLKLPTTKSRCWSYGLKWRYMLTQSNGGLAGLYEVGTGTDVSPDRINTARWCLYVANVKNKTKKNAHVCILVSSVRFSRKGSAQVQVRLLFCPAGGLQR